MQRKRYVIMMAAGCGSRMGAKIPKQFLEIGGKVILRRSIEAFIEACPDIRVVTVLSEQYIPYWEKYCMEKNFLCPQVIVKGGITRFHSVRNALEKIPYVQQTETQISLDQAIERQVWVKEYQNTSFSASIKKNKKENKD